MSAQPLPSLQRYRNSYWCKILWLASDLFVNVSIPGAESGFCQQDGRSLWESKRNTGAERSGNTVMNKHICQREAAPVACVVCTDLGAVGVIHLCKFISDIFLVSSKLCCLLPLLKTTTVNFVAKSIEVRSCFTETTLF